MDEKALILTGEIRAAAAPMAVPAIQQDHLAFLAELAAMLQGARERPGASAEERGRCERWLAHTAALSAMFGVKNQPRVQTDLPAALLKELRHRESDQLERQILAVLAACNGSADLDQILIGLYRGFGLVEKRRAIQNKLWRLVRNGRISKARDTRNVFTLDKRQTRNRRRERRQ